MIVFVYPIYEHHHQDHVEFALADRSGNGGYNIVSDSHWLTLRGSGTTGDVTITSSNVNGENDDVPLIGEDMRVLVTTDDRMFACWCVHHNHHIWMNFAELHYDATSPPTPSSSLSSRSGSNSATSGSLYVKHPIRSMVLGHERTHSQQKNWVMFEYQPVPVPVVKNATKALRQRRLAGRTMVVRERERGNESYEVVGRRG